MAVFFTADTHFGHQGIINLCKRPYQAVEEMDAGLISNWNQAVSDEDEVWHLGDFSLGKAEIVIQYRMRLKGKIHLIWGNHDHPEVRALPIWASSQPYAEIVIQNRRLVLSHYAFRVWNGSHKGERGPWHLFGHSHGRLEPLDWSCDVGVDVPNWRYRPISFKEISGLLYRRDRTVDGG